MLKTFWGCLKIETEGVERKKLCYFFWGGGEGKGGLETTWGLNLNITFCPQEMLNPKPYTAITATPSPTLYINFKYSFVDWH